MWMAIGLDHWPSSISIGYRTIELLSYIYLSVVSPKKNRLQFFLLIRLVKCVLARVPHGEKQFAVALIWLQHSLLFILKLCLLLGKLRRRGDSFPWESVCLIQRVGAVTFLHVFLLHFLICSYSKCIRVVHK